MHHLQNPHHRRHQRHRHPLHRGTCSIPPHQHKQLLHHQLRHLQRPGSVNRAHTSDAKPHQSRTSQALHHHPRGAPSHQPRPKGQHKPSRAKQRTPRYPETAHTKNTPKSTPASSHTTQAPPALSLPESDNHPQNCHAAATTDHPPPAPPDQCPENPKPPEVRRPTHTQGTQSVMAGQPPSPTAPTPKIPPAQPPHDVHTNTNTGTHPRPLPAPQTPYPSPHAPLRHDPRTVRKQPWTPDIKKRGKGKGGGEKQGENREGSGGQTHRGHQSPEDRRTQYRQRPHTRASPPSQPSRPHISRTPPGATKPKTAPRPPRRTAKKNRRGRHTTHHRKLHGRQRHKPRPRNPSPPPQRPGNTQLQLYPHGCCTPQKPCTASQPGTTTVRTKETTGKTHPK